MLLVSQDLQMMSICKSRFLRDEHGRIEQEVVELWWVDELWHELESACRESQDWAAEATGAQATEMRAVKQVTAAKQKLDATKAHLVETEAALRKSLEALEAE